MGPYAEIYNTLRSYAEKYPNWKAPAIGSVESDDLDFEMHEWSLEGPAGTGKTYAEGVMLEGLHSLYPGIRTAVIRKFRSSLTNSFMQVFEDDVLGENHPLISRHLSRKNRTEYIWWKDGVRSETMLSGLDSNNMSRLYSTQFDVVFLVEAIEFTEDEYESIYRAMRNTAVPFKAIICDTNPGNPNHFLNRRPEEPGKAMQRVLTRHYHNPRYFNPRTKKWTAQGRQYIGEILNQYTGVRRKRMLEGIWCAAEGAIYPQFIPDVGGPYVFDPGDPTEEKPFGINCPDYEYFMAGIDFGHIDATCLQVWGVTKDRNADMLAEWYGYRVGLDVMAEWSLSAYGEFGFVRGVADHRPELIEFLNQKFGWRERRRGHDLWHPAQKGQNSITPGLELVSDLMGNPGDGGRPTRIRFSCRASRYNCPEVRSRSRPNGVVQELPGYVWAEQKEDRPAKNEPDPGSIDHGADTMRYVLTELQSTNFKGPRRELTAAEAFSPSALDNMSPALHAQMVEKYADM